MARGQRVDLGNYVYHVINRSNGRVPIFHTEEDYKDFEYLLNEVKETYYIRILAYVIMPNHWHLLVYPQKDGELSRALQWLGTSHTRRFHVRTKTIGGGHLYQGRYKSFLIENDSHLLTVLKYVERNPVRAKLCEYPEGWRWGSAYRRICGSLIEKRILGELPVDLPNDYVDWIRISEPSEDLKTIRNSVNKGASYGGVLLPTGITT